MFAVRDDLEAMQARLVECEMVIADARVEQTALLCRMDVNQVKVCDGHRSMVEGNTTDTPPSHR